MDLWPTASASLPSSLPPCDATGPSWSARDGSTHQTIYMPDIESINVPLPSTVEQDLIVEAVWERLRRIDRAVDVLNDEMSLLAERRQALITAGVTGELDIPGVAA